MRKPFSMYFWNNKNQKSSHELLNPYKSSEEVNKGKNAISIWVQSICIYLYICFNLIFFYFQVTFFNNFSSTVTFPQENHLDFTETDDKNKRVRRKTLKHFAEVQNLFKIKNIFFFTCQELDRIASRDPLHSITLKEKELLRGLEDDVRLYHPTLLPRMIDCVDYTNYQVKQIKTHGTEIYQRQFFILLIQGSSNSS